MADDSWIEQRSRIPFVGIIAMVLIVAVVAVFLKQQILPDSTVSVTSADNVKGSASSSFAGIREVPLHKKEYLAATFSTRAGARSFIVDAGMRLLTIVENGKREEVELQQDGDHLIADFEYNTIPTRVDIGLADRSMVYTEPGRSATPIDLVLSDIVAWQGTFNFRNTQYLFQFYPGTRHANINSDRTYTIQLVEDGSTYHGMWNDGPTSRPVTIDTKKSLATIEEVY